MCVPLAIFDSYAYTKKVTYAIFKIMTRRPIPNGLPRFGLNLTIASRAARAKVLAHARTHAHTQTRTHAHTQTSTHTSVRFYIVVEKYK